MSKRGDPEDRVFEVGQKVCFSERFLSGNPEAKKRFSGRIGAVAGYRAGSSEPIVDFPKDGRRKARRLFEVSHTDLQIVERV